MDVPPPIPPRPPGYELRAPANPPPQQQQYAQAPPLPQRPLPQQGQQSTQYPGSYGVPPPPPPTSQGQGQPPPAQWSELFYPDGAATPLFEELMAGIFAQLDPGRTGYITPEVLSNFLDLSTFNRQDNIWKNNLNSRNPMFAPEDIADTELLWACEAWGFEHAVSERHPGRPQLPYGGMPRLTARGFADMMAVEHAAEPERGFRALNAALRAYPAVLPPLPRPLPRAALPAACPPQVQRRVDDVTLRARAAAQRKLDATHAQMRIQAQGRRAALDLVSDNRYYYY